MKILIACDGSECSNAMIEDLSRAGLPEQAEVSILSVAELSRQLVGIPYGGLAIDVAPFQGEPDEDSTDNYGLKTARNFATQAADWLAGGFPGWNISTEAWVDDPSSAILRKAQSWPADLIVVGCRGNSSITRFVLGSVSQHVLHHTSCSVRISRPRLHRQDQPIRVLIAIDGSDGAAAAAKSVAARHWPLGAEAHIVSVLDSQLSLASGAAALEGTTSAGEKNHVVKLLQNAVKDLDKAGLIASSQMLVGKPGESLVAEAEKWAADCIFVGARGLNGLERFLLGSVSTKVALHAHCSVEIVRRKA